MFLSVPEWRFPTTMSAMIKTTTKTKILKEATPLSKIVENQTHDKTTEDRVGYGEFMVMMKVTKKHLNCQINWGSVHKGLSFVK